jgi:SAM-dependent methyltransferase
MVVDEREDKETFSSQDLLGRFLSFWRNKKVLRFVQGDLVDIACGDNRLVARYGKGVGIDIVNYGTTDIVVKNFHGLPLASRSVDTVTIIASLNYFEKPISVLTEVNRVLKDDGHLIVTMSNNTVMRIWHKLRESWAYKSGYSDTELRELFGKAHLTLEKKIPFMFCLNTIYVVRKKLTEGMP